MFFVKTLKLFNTLLLSCTKLPTTPPGYFCIRCFMMLILSKHLRSCINWSKHSNLKSLYQNKKPLLLESKILELHVTWIPFFNNFSWFNHSNKWSSISLSKIFLLKLKWTVFLLLMTFCINFKECTLHSNTVRKSLFTQNNFVSQSKTHKINQ